jgi:cytidylate kinase
MNLTKTFVLASVEARASCRLPDRTCRTIEGSFESLLHEAFTKVV